MIYLDVIIVIVFRLFVLEGVIGLFGLILLVRHTGRDYIFLGRLNIF